MHTYMYADICTNNKNINSKRDKSWMCKQSAITRSKPKINTRKGCDIG